MIIRVIYDRLYIARNSNVFYGGSMMYEDIVGIGIGVITSDSCPACQQFKEFHKELLDMWLIIELNVDRDPLAQVVASGLQVQTVPHMVFMVFTYSGEIRVCSAENPFSCVTIPLKIATKCIKQGDSCINVIEYMFDEMKRRAEEEK